MDSTQTLRKYKLRTGFSVDRPYTSMTIVPPLLSRSGLLEVSEWRKDFILLNFFIWFALSYVNRSEWVSDFISFIFGFGLFEVSEGGILFVWFVLFDLFIFSFINSFSFMFNCILYLNLHLRLNFDSLWYFN